MTFRTLLYLGLLVSMAACSERGATDESGPNSGRTATTSTTRVVVTSSAVEWPATSTSTTSTPVDSAPVSYATARFDVAVTSGIVFGSSPVVEPAPGAVELRLDLYEPTGDGVDANPPGAIVVHGGGFQFGDREIEEITRIAQGFATRGYLAISIDYRLLNGTDTPPAAAPGWDGFDGSFFVRAGAEDALMAHDWFVNNTAVDPDRVVIGGASAGSIIAVYLAYSADDDQVQTPDFAGVFNLWGGTSSFDDVAGDEPPLFTVHGEDDTVFPVAVADGLTARARDVGLSTEFYPVPDAAHGFASVPFFTTEAEPGVTLFQQMFNFFDRELAR